MSANADEPLTKVTLNLYTTDVLAAKAYYGHGWTAELRAFFHQHMMTTNRWAKLQQELDFTDD